jgi:hypothetical protein
VLIDFRAMRQVMIATVQEGCARKTHMHGAVFAPTRAASFPSRAEAMEQII